MKNLLSITWQKLLIVLLFICGLFFGLFTLAQRFFRARRYSAVTDQDSHRETARLLSHALGTNINLPFWEGWTESESKVIEILKPFYLDDFHKIAGFYRSVFTNGRDLKDDLIRYLSQSDLEEIAHVFYNQGKMPTSGAIAPQKRKLRAILAGAIQSESRKILDGLFNKWNFGKA